MRDLAEICDLVGPAGGANCDAQVMGLEGMVAPPAEDDKLRAPMRRFLQGSVDEVSFAGQEVGKLAALLVAPRAGTWEVEEVTVSSSRSMESQRFVCRRRLGSDRRADADAVQLLPVGADVVLYGDRQLSREQADRVRADSLSEYQTRKASQALANGLLVAGGSVATLALGGARAALPYAVGGLEGMVYFWLLSKQVEGITSAGAAGKSYSEVLREELRLEELRRYEREEEAMLRGARPSDPAAAPGGLARVAESTPFRYLVLFAMLYAFFWGVQSVGHVESDSTGFKTLQIALGVLGFLQYKVALLITSVVPLGEDDAPGQALVRDEVSEKLGGRQ